MITDYLSQSKSRSATTETAKQRAKDRFKEDIF